MQQTKLVAALVIIGAFVAGGAIGVAGDRALRPGGHSGGPSDSRTFWDRTATEWGLSTTQRAVVDSLMDAQHSKISALYKPLRPAIDSADSLARIISDSTQSELRRVLTPEQQTKLDAMRADMRKRDSTRRTRRKPN
ncbi:MAG: hypothetical protein ABI026_05140 [Gemmatimonadaceae bacterium]